MLNSSRDQNEGAHRINSRGGVPAIYGTLLLILRSIRLKLRKGGSRRIGAETNIGSGKKTGKTNEYLVRVEIVNKIDAVSVSDRTRLRFDIYSYNPSLLAIRNRTLVYRLFAPPTCTIFADLDRVPSARRAHDNKLKVDRLQGRGSNATH